MLRRHAFGNGVFAVDCGAHIGVHTVEYAKLMHGWGSVIGFEAQEPIYYALAGNVAINNCFNASFIHAAVGSEVGEINIPVPNYFAPMSFGSLELRNLPDGQAIGQTIDYSETKLKSVRLVTLDSYAFQRVDLIKIDVEGMEMEVLFGAEKTIDRCKPILSVEKGKSDSESTQKFLAKYGYVIFDTGGDFLAIHISDPVLQTSDPILKQLNAKRINIPA